MSRRLLPLTDYFSESGGCWEWQGRKDDEGYGRWGSKAAHRAVWTLRVGPIPDGLTLDHLCRNHACVNPAHLEPVTIAVNTLRGFGAPAVNARKERCDHGHPFDAANTRWVTGKTGKPERACRACNAAAAARSRAGVCPQCGERQKYLATHLRRHAKGLIR